MAVTYFSFAFCFPFIVRSITVIWSSQTQQGGVYDAVIGKEGHRGMGQVKPSALNHLSGKAWDLSVIQTLKGWWQHPETTTLASEWPGSEK